MLIRLFIGLVFLAHSGHGQTLKIDPQITVSGLSSGGYMASQFQVAYSSIVKGAGILAAGPYYCAQGNLVHALYKCMDSYMPAPSGDKLFRMAKGFAAAGKIDLVKNLKYDKVFILTGTKDRTVPSKIVELNLGFYKSLNPGAIKLVNDLPVGHAFPTLNYGNPCQEVSERPWISDCGRDIAGEMLKHLLGPLRGGRSGGSASFFRFDQPRAKSISSQGVAFIPESCAKGKKCQLHVSFHGCHQGEADLGDAYYKNVGINEWAVNNNIVVVYPQAEPSFGNPNGCWDWWGYSGSDYAFKSGEQMRAVKSVIDRFMTNKLEFERYE